MPFRPKGLPSEQASIENAPGPSSTTGQTPVKVTMATEATTTPLLLSIIPEQLLRTQIDQPVRVQIHTSPRPGARPTLAGLPSIPERPETPSSLPRPVSFEETPAITFLYDASREPRTTAMLTNGFGAILEVQTQGAEELDHSGVECLRERAASFELETITSVPQAFLFERLSKSAMEAAMDGAPTSPEDTNISLHQEKGFQGILFTLLHCLSQAITNILIQNVVESPMAKIAFFASFGFTMGTMSRAFKLKSSLASNNVQLQLLLRSLSSLMALMLKVQALRFITVSDMAIVYSTVPIGVMVVSRYLLDEQMRVRHWISVLLCAAGVIVVMRPDAFFKKVESSRQRERVKGFLFGFGSALSLVVLVIIIRSMRNLSGQFLGFNSGLIRSILSLCVAVFTGSFGGLLSGRYLGTLLMLGKTNFCAIDFLNKALEREPAATVAVVKFCGDVICSIVLQIVFTQIYPDWSSAVGSGLVLASCLLVVGGKAMSWWSHRAILMMKHAK